VNHSLYCISRATYEKPKGKVEDQVIGWFNTQTSDFHKDRYTYTHVVEDYPLNYTAKFIEKKGKPLFVYELLNPEFRTKKKRRISTQSKFDEKVGFAISFGGNIKKKDGTPLKVQILCDQYQKTVLKTKY
jgi:hypothetical protein